MRRLRRRIDRQFEVIYRAAVPFAQKGIFNFPSGRRLRYAAIFTKALTIVSGGRHEKFLSVIILLVVAAAFAVHAFAADVPQDGLIGHFKLDGDLVNDVTGQSATRLYREFHPLDEESERTSHPTFYDGLDGMCYTISNYHVDTDLHYAIDTGVSPGNGDFTFGMWLLDERPGGTNLEYMRYGDSVYRLHSDEPYKFFSIETGSAYSASGGNWLSMGPMISYTVCRC